MKDKVHPTSDKVCIYVSMYICMYKVCMYVYMYVCLCTLNTPYVLLYNHVILHTEHFIVDCTKNQKLSKKRVKRLCAIVL